MERQIILILKAQRWLIPFVHFVLLSTRTIGNYWTFQTEMVFISNPYMDIFKSRSTFVGRSIHVFQKSAEYQAHLLVFVWLVSFLSTRPCRHFQRDLKILAIKLFWAWWKKYTLGHHLLMQLPILGYFPNTKPRNSRTKTYHHGLEDSILYSFRFVALLDLRNEELV